MEIIPSSYHVGHTVDEDIIRVCQKDDSCFYIPYIELPTERKKTKVSPEFTHVNIFLPNS